MLSQSGDGLKRLVHDEAGATAVEYAIMLALILMVVFLAIQFLGVNVRQAFDNFVNRFAAALS